MLGHGSPWGLLSVGQFPFTGPYIIDDSIAVELKEKQFNLYIRYLLKLLGEFFFNHREHGLTRKYAEENLRDLRGEIVVQTKLYNPGSEGISKKKGSLRSPFLN